MKYASLLSQDKIKVEFPFDFATINNIKTITNRTWNAEKKYWSVPLSSKNISALLHFGFTIDPALNNYLLPVEPAKKIEPITIPGLKGTLRPFQEIGVAEIESRNCNILLADDMGLGKTIQALAYLQLHPELRPAIIVCTASLKLNWKIEAQKWLSEAKCQIITGTKLYSLQDSQNNIFIINYDILGDWVEYLSKTNPKILICDEVHRIKNNTAQRTKAVKTLSKRISKLLFLSGTPIENRPIEIYNSWKILDPNSCPNYFEFGKRYCNARHNGYGWDFNGASNTAELHSRLKESIMIRRLKKDVLTELPDKVYSTLPFEIENKKEYEFAENDFINFIRNKTEESIKEKYKNIDRDLFSINQSKLDELKNAAANKAMSAEILSQIEVLKQVAVKGKLNSIIYNWIPDFLESDEKLVIFAHHKFVIEKLHEAFPKVSVKIDGSTSIEDRQKNIESFQNNKNCKICIISEAGGEGITLTAASHILFMEYPWTPGRLDQIISRLHRIGQKNSVNIYFSIASDTIEEKIISLVKEKQIIVNSILDGNNIISDSVLTDVINQYYEKIKI